MNPSITLYLCWKIIRCKDIILEFIPENDRNKIVFFRDKKKLQ